MGVGGPLLYWHSFVDSTGSLSAAVRFTAWAIVALLDAAVGAFCIYIGGLEELQLDLERRTYRLVRGWPFFPSLGRGLGKTWRESV